MRWTGVAATLCVLLFGSGCALSARAGPRISETRGDVAVQGEGTLSVSLASKGLMVGIPVTFATGARTDDGKPLTQIDSGVETCVSGEAGRLSLCARALFGGTLAGPPPAGGYLGGRLGPMFLLTESKNSLNKTYSFLSLDGIAFTSLGASPNVPTFGGALTFGYMLIDPVRLHL